jgi:hypothetical protein
VSGPLKGASCAGLGKDIEHNFSFINVEFHINSSALLLCRIRVRLWQIVVFRSFNDAVDLMSPAKIKYLE